MRFTFAIMTLCKGGAQRMLVELCNGLVERGHRVTIVMPIHGAVEFKVKANIIRSQDDELHESDYPPGDVIVSNFYTTVPSAKAASESGKGVHVRLSLCYEPMFLTDQERSFPTYHVTRHLLVLSEYQRDLIKLNHGLEGRIVPIGISPVFQNLHLRNPNRPLCISAVIRLPEGWSWHRQQEHLIQQLRTVKQQHPEVHLRFICPPNELAQSKRLQSLKTEGLFQFQSPKNDQELCRYYNQADIFVTSSIFEAAPLPGLEAMRTGAALVGVYAGGNTEYARNGDNCLLSYRYENRLAQDIQRLIVDRNLRETLMRNGEAEASKWTWERSLNFFCHHITQITSKS